MKTRNAPRKSAADEGTKCARCGASARDAAPFCAWCARVAPTAIFVAPRDVDEAFPDSKGGIDDGE